MITVNDILGLLNAKFPTDTACDFDNIGLLVGNPSAQVTNAVVALDCALETVEFAKQIGAQLIITHHPVIFDPIKSLTAGSVPYEVAAAGISVISMHTNLDMGSGGVNDTLCEILGLGTVTPYTAADGYLLKCGTVDAVTPDRFAQHIKACLGGHTVRYVDGGKKICRVLVCSGSGGSFLWDAVSGGFDALVTADVKHNVLVDAANVGISVFDAGHFATEDIIVSPLCKRLSAEFSEISFTEYHTDKIRDI